MNQQQNGPNLHARTTLDMDPELFKRIKDYAAKYGTSFRQVMLRSVVMFMDEDRLGVETPNESETL